MRLPKFLQLKPQEEFRSDEEMRNLQPTSFPGIPYEEPCRHQWKERTQSYAPPQKDIQPTTQDTDLLSSLLLGVTTIIDECLLCSEQRKTSFLGNPNPQLDLILDNVVQYGPQYMQRNNHTFVFQEYFPPRQTTNIPIR